MLEPTWHFQICGHQIKDPLWVGIDEGKTGHSRSQTRSYPGDRYRIQTKMNGENYSTSMEHLGKWGVAWGQRVMMAVDVGEVGHDENYPGFVGLPEEWEWMEQEGEKFDTTNRDLARDLEGEDNYTLTALNADYPGGGFGEGIGTKWGQNEGDYCNKEMGYTMMVDTGKN